VNPLADKCRATEEFEACEFARTQEAHRLRVKIRNFGKVDNGAVGATLQFCLKRVQMFESKSAYQPDDG
jgi:hypothetical protein